MLPYTKVLTVIQFFMKAKKNECFMVSEFLVICASKT